ncbi:MAG: oligoendopeptidase F [Planctomycetota bacterium]
MRRVFFPLLIVVFAMLFLSMPAASADRATILDAEKWNLADIYGEDQDWTNAKNQLAERMPEMDAFKGKLGESADQLFQCLNLQYEIMKEFGRLRSYATMKSDLDMRDSTAMEMKLSLGPMMSDFGARISWMTPEILTLPLEKIESYYSIEPGLKIYKSVIDDMLRSKAHTLSPMEEEILANTGLMSGNAAAAYSIFTNAEMPRDTITLSSGEDVRLDIAAYCRYRGVPEREDRELVFRTFFSNINDFRGTFGTLLNGHVKSHLFTMKSRKFENSLAASLHGPNIPTTVYYNLIRNVRKNLPTLWRYLELRKRIMGVDQLKYSDLYASITKAVDVEYSVDDAKAMVLKGVAPLGEEYVKVVAEGLEKRWVDWHPSPGKRGGAYSNGSTYGSHPFILLNFTGTYDVVSTLAHELGHSMHSYFSNKEQPFPTSRYTTFVAEVASTCNEHLLMDYMLKNTDDDAMKLFLLGSYLDNVRQTLFRQTQFAEFELRIHEMVEAGQALTGDNLNAVYKEILNAYYGTEKGITEIDPVCNIEWAYIHHFYYNFYVYSYSTSITASTALSRKIINKEPGAVDNYLRFLSLGDSLPPVDELKVAGVDMTTDEPFTATMESMNSVMDEIETILDRMGS